MSLVNLTKQLAEQTISKQIKDTLDLKPEPAAKAEKSETHVAALLLAELQNLQKTLKEDQELYVTSAAGSETVRVLEVYVPEWPVMVITGANSEKAIVRVIAPSEQVQFVCKVSRIPADAKPHRIQCKLPK